MTTSGKTRQAGDEAKRAGQEAKHHDAFDALVRVGLASYGLVHLLIAYLAVKLALGDNEGSPSQNGALAQLAENTGGRVLLWAITVGFVALVIWQLLEAAIGHEGEDGTKRTVKRAGSVLKAVLYGALGYSAAKVAASGGSASQGSSSKEETMTAKLMSLPLGPLIVGLVGVAILAYGGYQIFKGVTKRFTDKLDAEGKSGTSGDAFIRLGQFGHIARGVALGIVGGLFVYAAATHDADKSGGLDDALKTVLEQPFGSVLLFVIALGLAAFGIFCLAWARHRGDD